MSRFSSGQKRWSPAASRDSSRLARRRGKAHDHCEFVFPGRRETDRCPAHDAVSGFRFIVHLIAGMRPKDAADLSDGLGILVGAVVGGNDDSPRLISRSLAESLRDFVINELSEFDNSAKLGELPRLLLLLLLWPP